MAHQPPQIQPASAREPALLSQPDADPDLPLIEAIRAGNAAAWSTLLTRYEDRVFALCLGKVHSREMAADLTQDVMVKLLQHLDSYDGRARLSTWVYRITLNVCFSKLRSEKYRRHASLEGMAAGSSARPSATDREPTSDPGLEQSREHSAASGVEDSEELGRMRRALERLEEEHRDILLLRDSRGLDYEQIGEVLNIAVGTVKSRLFRARAALREAMESMGPG